LTTVTRHFGVCAAPGQSWFTSFVLRRRLKRPVSAYAELARENITIFASRSYTSASGSRVHLNAAIEHCLQTQKNLGPKTSYELQRPRGPHAISIEVTQETTTPASYRLAVGLELPTAALDFANCLRVGGGFLNGAVAQEEAVCRSSVLYTLLSEQPEMYVESRKHKNGYLFRDYLVLSPDVPVIRDDQYDIFDSWFPVSFITAAAPDLRHRAIAPHRVRTAIDSRIRKIVRCAVQHGAQAIILGAFGCGTFRNGPTDVAQVFGKVLVDEKLATYRVSHVKCSTGKSHD
jgi:uncharacterized protein (TIGR02452 family)